MIIVKVELRSARTLEVKEIGRMHISNTGGEVSDQFGNYIVEVFKRGSLAKVQRHGLVTKFPRKSYNVWRLVLRALKNTFPEERDGSKKDRA